jgi:arylsulfatase A-like enzyme
MEPHPPYAPPRRLLGRMRAGTDRGALQQISSAMLTANRRPPDEATRRDIERAYDAEVASLDQQLRMLFDILAVRGVLENTVVVVTADHGEAFGDHATFGHGVTLFNELVRVPLLVRMPGQRARHDVDEPVSLVDLAPTLIELAGGPIPASFEGRSLRATLDPAAGGAIGRWLERRSASAGPVFSELIEGPGKNLRLRPHERAVVLGTRKLIAGPAGEVEVYDLRADPFETAPQPASGGLREALGDFSSRVRARPAPAAAVPLDPDTHERLRALGYVN